MSKIAEQREESKINHVTMMLLMMMMIVVVFFIMINTGNV